MVFVMSRRDVCKEMLCYSPDDVQPHVSSRLWVANVEMSFYVMLII